MPTAMNEAAYTGSGKPEPRISTSGGASWKDSKKNAEKYSENYFKKLFENPLTKPNDCVIIYESQGNPSEKVILPVWRNWQTPGT